VKANQIAELLFMPKGCVPSVKSQLKPTCFSSVQINAIVFCRLIFNDVKQEDLNIEITKRRKFRETRPAGEMQHVV
jgi:hypothetical protein